MRIGSVLRECRNHYGLTLKETAERAGISLSYLSDIERSRTLPSLKTIAKLAGALDQKIWWFFLPVSESDILELSDELD